MKHRFPSRTYRLSTLFLALFTIALSTTCARMATKPLPLTLLFTSEVRGYLGACG
jgi:hypothetical protein